MNIQHVVRPEPAGRDRKTNQTRDPVDWAERQKRVEQYRAMAEQGKELFGEPTNRPDRAGKRK